MAAPDLEVRLGIEYANHDGVALLGDLYTPAAPGAYPTLLLIHGGAWKMGSRASYQYWGPYLARRGYTAFAVDCEIRITRCAVDVSLSVKGRPATTGMSSTRK